LNLRVKKKSFNKLEALAGAKLNTDFQAKGYMLTPQIHAFIDCELLRKAPRALVSLDGLPGPYVPFVTKKPNRFLYNVGTAIAVTKNLIESELTYDFRYTKKYPSHQIALKLRLEF
jgi:outer membrane autotransporter protein